MRGNTIQPSLQDRTCTASAVADGAGIVVSCQYDVPAERAHAFSKALLEQVHPAQVRRAVCAWHVVICALQGARKMFDGAPVIYLNLLK